MDGIWFPLLKFEADDLFPYTVWLDECNHRHFQGEQDALDFLTEKSRAKAAYEDMPDEEMG